VGKALSELLQLSLKLISLLGEKKEIDGRKLGNKLGSLYIIKNVLPLVLSSSYVTHRQVLCGDSKLF